MELLLCSSRSWPDGKRSRSWVQQASGSVASSQLWACPVAWGPRWLWPPVQGLSREQVLGVPRGSDGLIPAG